MRLKENLEQAVNDPNKDIHLALRLQRLFKLVEDEKSLPDQVTDTLDEIKELSLDALFGHLFR